MQQEYSRKRPLHPKGEERLNSQGEGMQRRMPNRMHHYGPEGRGGRGSGPPQRSAKSSIQHDMSQRQDGERQRQGVIHPERRWDDSRSGNDTTRFSWDRRIENDNGKQRLDLGEGTRSNVWRPDVQPHVNRSQSNRRQDSRERPIPPKLQNDNWRYVMTRQPPRNGQRQEDASGPRESGLPSGFPGNPCDFSISYASRDYKRNDSGHSMPSPLPRVTWNESDGSRFSFDSDMGGCQRRGSNDQSRSPSSHSSFDDNLGRPGFQRWSSKNRYCSPSSTPSDGCHGSHSPASRGRPGWSKSGCNNFQGGPKHSRITGPRQQDERWHSNRLARRQENTQRDNSSIQKAPTHDSKSFAGRFFPRAEAAEHYEKHIMDKPSIQVRANADVFGVDIVETGDREGFVAHHVATWDAEGAAAEDQGVELQQMQPKIANAKSGVVENQEKVTIVMKLPASLEGKGNSLKDIVKDTFTPELTEASVETNLRASASYSSCSLAHAQSMIAIASPHSLTHPEDERMETETYVQEKIDAGWKVTPEDTGLKETSLSVTETEGTDDVVTKGAPLASSFADVRHIFAEDQVSAGPTPAHWVRRSTRQQRLARSCGEDVPMSVLVTVDTEGSLTKEAEGQDSAAGVPAHWVRRSIRQPSRSVLSDSDHVSSTQKPFASSMGHIDSDSSDSSDDETDEEELRLWAQKMLGVPPPVAVAQLQIPTEDADAPIDSSDEVPEHERKSGKCKSSPRPRLTLHLKMGSTKKPSKALRQKKPASPRRKGKVGGSKASKTAEQKRAEEAQVLEEAKRKKDLAKPLTAADVRRILAEDVSAAPATHWVRRSDRQPSRSALNHPSVRSLIGKLRDNDYDMTVLKMKKYLSDPDTPQMVIDAALDALEENTNCQALYIQNFNQGMRDEQVLHLLKILQMPSCNIWCLNIGETYNVKMKTWELFAKGLKTTKITHMYASEHTITSALKDEIRETIRKNRSKHDMHISPDNLDVIVQCTHCWWNPVNAKVLRPYLSKRGLDYILHDKEAQGLQGSMSAALAGDLGSL